MKKFMINGVTIVLALFTALSSFACSSPEESDCDHIFCSSNIKVYATCESTGLKETTCLNCGDVFTEEIPKLSHNYKGKVTKEASCESSGIEKFTCNNCGDSYTEIIPKTNCKYTSRVTKEATCSNSGIRTFTCSDCGDSYTQSIPKNNNHDYERNANGQSSCSSTGTITYTCRNCGDSYTESGATNGYTASEIFEKSKNSVGEIITYDINGDELALGTGFAISKDGRILTNYHVIEDSNSAKITINGKTYTVNSVLAYDKDIDLAVLKINATNLIPVITCNKTHAVGKTVYALGSSRGLTATFSQGIITYADREMEGVHYVQHDAAISGGNSGGPLINEYCEVIGINTMTIRDSQNLNFAISVKELDNLTYGTPITLANLFKKTDAFAKLKNYLVENGEYDASNKTYSIDFSKRYWNSTHYSQLGATYYVDKNYVNLTNFVYKYDLSFYIMSFLEIDGTSGIYDWSVMDENYYYMNGYIYGSTFTSSTVLTYTNQYGFSSSLYTVRSLASDMIASTLTYMKTDYKSIGITPKDFGFVNFS